MVKILGVNHITFAVKNLSRSLDFYQTVLNAVLVHKGRTDAYLEWGPVWICLLERGEAKKADSKSAGVDHAAFTVHENDFDQAVGVLKSNDVKIVRGPIKRGGGRCVNFLDPDGIQLELNTGSLAGRMENWV
ncbi:VOC family protein [Fictibacillus sp. NRS-1165]|uniref:VOC family protein n=1 Tax=Fictibacillus sp. NRS-1165 TaxID=3144463 RepID=UPI003D216AA4